MTGLERLRALSGEIFGGKPCDELHRIHEDADYNCFGRHCQTCRRGALEKIADQIERETAHDPSEDVSMSAYDLLPQEEREAIAWVREHGGLGAVKNMAAITLDVYQRLVDGNAGLEMLETDADTISSMMAEIDEAIVKRGKERTTALALLDESIPRVTYERHILKRQRQIDESHAALRRKSERIGFLVSELNRANNENHEMFIRRAGDYTAFADEVCKRLAPELRYVEGCSKDVMDAALHALDRRLMPEGMEWLLDVWPKWSNGEYCKFGDWWKAEKYGEREPQQLRRLAFFTPEQLREWGQDEGENFGYEWDYMRPSDTTYRPDKVEPPAPKVLDADGVEIRVGDTVYTLNDSRPYVVVELAPGAAVINAGGAAINVARCADQLTHRAPVLAADGKRIQKGDVLYDRAGYRFEVIKDPEDERAVIANFTDEEGKVHRTFTKAEEFTHDKPVLAADGLALRVGESVWHTQNKKIVKVVNLTKNCYMRNVIDVEYEDGRTGRYSPNVLTHEQPDSWERLEADAKAWVNPTMEERAELISRAKKLAGVER